MSEHMPPPPDDEDTPVTDPEPAAVDEDPDREADDDTAVDSDVIAHAVADQNAPMWCIGVAGAG